MNYVRQSRCTCRKRNSTEIDNPNTINTFGISKLVGEIYTRQNEKHYIVRVASLFDIAGASGKRGNFMETMIKKAEMKEEIKDSKVNRETKRSS
ncbi:MAG: sugar nucleotide-binding protein [Thermoproteota archaeon]